MKIWNNGLSGKTSPIQTWDHEQETKPIQMYDPQRTYFNNGYKLMFLNYWILFYNDRKVMIDDNKDFFSIIEMLELKPWKVKPVKEDEFDRDIYLNQVSENLSSWREVFPDNPDLILAEKSFYGEVDTAGKPQEYKRELELTA